MDKNGNWLQPRKKKGHGDLRWTKEGDGYTARGTADGTRRTYKVVKATGGYNLQVHLDGQMRYLNQANVQANGTLKHCKAVAADQNADENDRRGVGFLFN